MKKIILMLIVSMSIRAMDAPNTSSSKQPENFYISDVEFAKLSEKQKEELRQSNVIVYNQKEIENPKFSKKEKELLQIFIDTYFLYQVQKYRTFETRGYAAAANFLPIQYRSHTYETALEKHQALKPKKHKIMDEIGEARALFIATQADEQIIKEMKKIGM